MPALTDIKIHAMEAAQRFARRFGADIVRFNAAKHPVARRLQILKHHQIDTVLDVGANAGQFGAELRRYGYRGHIVSFEPLSAAYTKLNKAARGDPRWNTLNIGLGDVEGRQTLHVAGNSESSSIRPMLALHAEAAPESRYSGEETIVVHRLDDLFSELCAAAKNIYLKIDTQGYEAEVLRGAEKSLPYIDTLQVEMSLAPLYEGQVLFEDQFKALRGAGYKLVAVETNFGDSRTGHLLQLDGIFRRECGK